jgi:hypothetical protein
MLESAYEIVDPFAMSIVKSRQIMNIFLIANLLLFSVMSRLQELGQYTE